MENIPTLEHYAATKDGQIWSYRKGMSGGNKFLKQELDKRGYLRVRLYSKTEFTSKKWFVHRLVAMTYIPNLENKPEVNHINGITTDNRVENLEWVTKNENIRHSFEVLGKTANKPWAGKTGEKNHSSKAVIGYTMSGSFKQKYGSCQEAERELKKMGIKAMHISSCAANAYGRKTSGRFNYEPILWKYI
jgi:hypothetical protein